MDHLISILFIPEQNKTPGNRKCPAEFAITPVGCRSADETVLKYIGSICKIQMKHMPFGHYFKANAKRII